jgi:uncharacterized membrane protein
MSTFLKVWLVACAILLPVDFFWLRSMQWFYRQEMGELLLDQLRFGVAAAFYVVFAAGIAWFAIIPNLQATSALPAILAGAFLGLVAYGTYDATNYATMKGYPLSIMIVDWLWGVALSAMTAGLGWTVIRRFALS